LQLQLKTTGYLQYATSVALPAYNSLGAATEFKGLNADAPEEGRMPLIRSDWRKRSSWRVGLLGNCRSGYYGRESEPCAETNKKKKITAAVRICSVSRSDPE
jgi:hypothetical protein